MMSKCCYFAVTQGVVFEALCHRAGSNRLADMTVIAHCIIRNVQFFILYCSHVRLISREMPQTTQRCPVQLLSNRRLARSHPNLQGEINCGFYIQHAGQIIQID